MDLKLKGKTVLITGGSQGIGLSMAKMYAHEGCKVRLVARGVENLEQACAELNSISRGAAEFIALDLSLRNAADRIFDAYPDIDILVNSAADSAHGSLFDVSDERMRHAWDVKVFGYTNLIRRYYEMMRRRESGGVILNIIGVAGEMLDSEYIVNSVGNASLIALTKALGARSLDERVRILGINPGPVETERCVDMLKSFAIKRFNDAGRWSELVQNYPQRRMATSEEVAAAALFLTSPLSSYTSGCMLNIDGGLSVRKSVG